MTNYEDFFCGECNFCVEVFCKRSGTMWCSLHNKRAYEGDKACKDYVLNNEEGDIWDEFDD